MSLLLGCQGYLSCVFTAVYSVTRGESACSGIFALQQRRCLLLADLVAVPTRNRIAVHVLYKLLSNT